MTAFLIACSHGGGSGHDGAAPDGAGTGGGAAPDGAGTGGAIGCRVAGDGKTTLAFVNRCASTLTFAGSDIAGGTLAPGAFACVDVGSATETISGKRYWGWLGADPGPERHTLAEFTFNTDFHDFDWYDISHVDAFNPPMQIVPVGHADCPTLTCAADFSWAVPQSASTAMPRASWSRA